MITCTRKLTFCSGHRLFGHEGKCCHLHGHNYVAFITAQSEQLDGVGRVIDFGVLKELVGGWIDREWDHGFILWQSDFPGIAVVHGLKDQKLFLLPTNPTAENMAEFLLRRICPEVLAETGVLVTRVVLWETENCYAEATL